MISKLTKSYHNDLTANNKEVLYIKAKTCTPLIIKFKEKYTVKTSKTPDNFKAVSKT